MIEKMKNLIFKILIYGMLLTAGIAFADNTIDAELSIEAIIASANSAAKINDSLYVITKYKFEAVTVFQRLNKDGSVKDTDTTLSIITRRGDEELGREIVYSSKGETDSKEVKKHEKEIALSFDDPDYNFSLIESAEDYYKVGIEPVNDPPLEGQYQGTILIDKQKFFTRRIDFAIPRPDGPLKEFTITMNFEPLEGGLVVPADMKMRGYFKVLLGIIKIRFAGEFKFSKYEILE